MAVSQVLLGEVSIDADVQCFVTVPPDRHDMTRRPTALIADRT
ncbi:hypothetical protein [Streptomyces sp. AcH 505]